VAESLSAPASRAPTREADLDNALKQWALLQWRQSGAFRRRLLLFVLGLVAGTGFAPFHVLPAWFVGWTGMIWCAGRARTRREVFLDAWLWGLGLTIPGIYWITSSFLIDAGRFGWLAPPILMALAPISRSIRRRRS
jgi:apolipoprotein N-acyltransferase